MSGISRRGLLAAGAGGAVLLGAPGTAAASPQLWRRPGALGAPPVSGLHLQFGSDASREAVVSWHSTASVARPRVLLGTPDGGFGHTAEAETTTYRDAKSGTEVQVHHARLTGLRPDTDYVYAALARRRRAGIRDVSHGAARSRAVHLHQLRRPGHADARQAYVPPPA